jgi:hypothetical protein
VSDGEAGIGDGKCRRIGVAKSASWFVLRVCLSIPGGEEGIMPGRVLGVRFGRFPSRVSLSGIARGVLMAEPLLVSWIGLEFRGLVVAWFRGASRGGSSDQMPHLALLLITRLPAHIHGVTDHPSS